VRLAQKAMEETRPVESALLETGVGMASTLPLAMADANNVWRRAYARG
jgi:hypothetical protein